MFPRKKKERKKKGLIHRRQRYWLWLHSVRLQRSYRSRDTNRFACNGIKRTLVRIYSEKEEGPLKLLLVLSLPTDCYFSPSARENTNPTLPLFLRVSQSFLIQALLLLPIAPDWNELPRLAVVVECPAIKKKPIQLAGQISNYYTRLVVTISAGLETIALYYQSNIYTYRVAVSSAVYWRATRACGWGEGANNRLFLPDGKLSQVRGRRWCYILLSQTTSSACLTSDVIPSSIWKGKKKYKSIKTLFAIKRKRGGGRKDGNGNTWQTAASGNSCADAFSSFPELATWLVRGSSCYPSDWLSSLFLIYARSVSGCNKDESIPTRQSSVQHQLSHTIYYSDDQYETTTTRAKISDRRWNLRRRPAAGRLTRICPGAAQSVWFAFLKV